ncbi:uncharacterized protein [Ambystoma mexicanum]|uniref:uncharacterized protein n=1 Tax=Ambystoma mexicanum TaxID=8296 RepID=UPI0037E96BD4
MPKKKEAQSLKATCLNSIAQNMQTLWLKDYVDNYIDEYNFLYIIGPFNELAGALVQELLLLLGESRRLTRASLHLLLLPHLTDLSLRSGSGLVSNAITQLVTARCKNLSSLDLHGCNRVPSAALVDLLEGLPRLTKLVLSDTQCNTLVLSAVCTTCKVLRELDISHCKKVVWSSLFHLVYDQTQQAFGCSKLRVLVMVGIEPRMQVEEFIQAVAFVLLVLPGLEYLDNSCVMEALCLIHKQEFEGIRSLDGFPSFLEIANNRKSIHVDDGDPRIVLSLKRVNEVDEHLLPMFSSLCQRAVEVVISLSDQPVLGWTSTSWSHLTHLTVHCTGHHGRPLSQMLPVLGGISAQLKLLSLNSFLYDDAFSFCAILNMCPNLRVLEMHLNPPANSLHAAQDIGQQDPEAEPFNADLRLIQQDFTHLRRLSVLLSNATGPLPLQHTVMLGATLSALLRRSPKLENVSLLCLPCSLDRVFQSVLEPPTSALMRLRELSLCQSRVSRSTVHSLLNATNHLSSLNLSLCPDIHRKDYDVFLKTVQKRRYDLNISWQ